MATTVDAYGDAYGIDSDELCATKQDVVSTSHENIVDVVVATPPAPFSHLNFDLKLDKDIAHRANRIEIDFSSLFVTPAAELEVMQARMLSPKAPESIAFASPPEPDHDFLLSNVNVGGAGVAPADHVQSVPYGGSFGTPMNTPLPQPTLGVILEETEELMRRASTAGTSTDQSVSESDESWSSGTNEIEPSYVIGDY